MQTNKKPHFEAPSPAAQACLLPRRYPACYGTRHPDARAQLPWTLASLPPLETGRLGRRVKLATGDQR